MGFMAGALKGARRLRTEPVKPPDADAPDLPGKGKGAYGRLGNISRNATKRYQIRQAKMAKRPKRNF